MRETPEAENIHKTIIMGTVDHWGEVIECEKGWRSEYAAIRTLDRVWGDPEGWEQLLTELRQTYNLTESDEGEEAA